MPRNSGNTYFECIVGWKERCKTSQAEIEVKEQYERRHVCLISSLGWSSWVSETKCGTLNSKKLNWRPTIFAKTDSVH